MPVRSGRALEDGDKTAVFIAAYVRAWAAKFPGRPEDLNDGKIIGQIRAWISSYPLERACELIQVYLQMDCKWFSTKGYDFMTFRNNLNKIGQALDSGVDPEGSKIDIEAILARRKQA